MQQLLNLDNRPDQVPQAPVHWALQLVEEKERKGIARSLHGELGGRLATVLLQLHQLEKALMTGERRLMTYIASIAAVVEEAIEVGQRSSTVLRPKILEIAGLVPAIRWLLEDYRKQSGILFELVPEGDKPEPNWMTSLLLFRVVQEALDNVVRHSRATRVKVILRGSASEIAVEIKDNGIGIADENTKIFSSLGLLGMQERVNLMHGELTIIGTPKKGTSVAVIIPVQKENKECEDVQYSDCR